MELNLSRSCKPFIMTSEVKSFECFVDAENLRPDVMAQISMILGNNSDEIKLAYRKYQNKAMPLEHFKNIFITEICDTFSVHDVVKALLSCTKLHSIGLKLFWYFYYSKPGRRTVNVPRLQMRCRKKTTSYFVFLKNAVHARNFFNPYEQVKKIAHQYLEKLKGRELEGRELQKISDMYVALKAIEYDACCNVDETASEDDERLNEMERILEQTTCPSISRVLLYGRKADAFSNLRMFEKGEKMLTEAYVCADLSHSCLEIVDMIYKGVVFKLTKFEQDTTETLQEEIMFDAQKALNLLSQEHKDDQKFWKALLLLRMAYVLLGIGKHCRMIQNYYPTKKKLKKANGILEMIDFKNLDHRKLMFYQVAKARYYQYTKRMNWCRDSITEAMKLAIIGNYAARTYIEKYGKTIGFNLVYLYDLDKVENRAPVMLNPLDEVTGKSVFSNTLPQDVPNKPVAHVFPDNLFISDEETEN